MEAAKSQIDSRICLYQCHFLCILDQYVAGTKCSSPIISRYCDLHHTRTFGQGSNQISHLFCVCNVSVLVRLFGDLWMEAVAIGFPTESQSMFYKFN